MNHAAIATLALGEKHLDFWRQFCQPSWEAYAAKHGYDLILIDQPFDRSELATSRSSAWQKCLLLSQPAPTHYRQVIVLDSNIVINQCALRRWTIRRETLAFSGAYRLAWANWSKGQSRKPGM